MDGPADRVMHEWFGLAFPGRAEAEADAVRPSTASLVADTARSLRWDRARTVGARDPVRGSLREAEQESRAA